MEPEYELLTDPTLIYVAPFSIIFILTISLNVLLLLIFIRHPVLITPPQLILINLSCSYLALALFAMTFGLVTAITGKWIFPGLVCDLVGFFNSTFQLVAMFSSFSLLNERYHHKMNQRRHTLMYTSRKVGITIMVFWVQSLALSALPFVPRMGHYQFSPDEGTCWTPSGPSAYTHLITHSIFLTLWTFLFYNLLTLPKLDLPGNLTKFQVQPPSYVPQLITSGIYAVGAVNVLIIGILKKADILNPSVESTYERVSVLTSYLVSVLIPLSVVVLNRDLRRCSREILSVKSNSGEHPQKKCELAPQPYPYSFDQRNLARLQQQQQQQQASSSHQLYMSLPIIREQPATNRPQPATNRPQPPQPATTRPQQTTQPRMTPQAQASFEMTRMKQTAGSVMVISPTSSSSSSSASVVTSSADIVDL